MKQNKAMFGISVFKRSITKDVIAEIARFMHTGYHKSMIILVDEPEIHNWLIRGRESKQHAKAVIDATAANRLNAINHVLRRFNLQTSTSRWSSISSDPDYDKNVMILKNFYKSDSNFKKDIHDKLQEYLGERIIATEIRLKRKLTAAEFSEMSEFMLEEIAGLALLHFKLGYSNDVYPDENNSLVNALFTGEKYHDLANALKVNPLAYKYIVHPEPGN